VTTAAPFLAAARRPENETPITTPPVKPAGRNSLAEKAHGKPVSVQSPSAPGEGSRCRFITTLECDFRRYSLFWVSLSSEKARSSEKRQFEKADVSVDIPGSFCKNPYA
jgi:hypothetical protein